MAITISVTSGSGYAGSTYTQTGAAGAGNWYADEDALSGETGNTFVIDSNNEGRKITFRTSSPAEKSNVLHYLIPSDIPNLVLWIDAYHDDAITFGTGSLVANIASRVGSLAFAQATGGSQPTWSATGRNGKPAFINTTGKNMALNTPASMPGSADPSSVVAVGYASNTPTSDNYRAIIGWGSGNTTGVYRIIGKGNSGARVLALAEAEVLSPVTVLFQNTDRIIATTMGAAGTVLDTDGQDTATNGTAVSTGVTSYCNLGMGRNDDPRRWEGSFQEILVYSIILSTDQRQKLEGYEAHKWGLTANLPSGHPYKTLPPEMPSFSGAHSGYLGTSAGVMSAPTAFAGAHSGYLGTQAGAFRDINRMSGADSGYLGTSAGAAKTTNKMAGVDSGYLGTSSGAIGQKQFAQGAHVGYLGQSFGSTSTEIEAAGAMSGYLGTSAGAAKTTNKMAGADEGYLGQSSGAFRHYSKIVGAHSGYLGTSSGEMIGAKFEGVGDHVGYLGQSEGQVIQESVAGFLGEFMGYLGTSSGVIYWDIPLLIVEDGTIVDDANSYVTLLYADDYMVKQGYDAWALASQRDREQALIRAAVSLDAIYGPRVEGTRTGGREQELLFPMTGVEDIYGTDIDPNEVPKEWKRAQCEMAWIELQTPGSTSPEWNGTQLVTQETLGPLSVTYSDPAKFGKGGNASTYPKVDYVLRTLLLPLKAFLFGESVRSN